MDVIIIVSVLLALYLIVKSFYKGDKSVNYDDALLHACCYVDPDFVYSDGFLAYTHKYSNKNLHKKALYVSGMCPTANKCKAIHLLKDVRGSGVEHLMLYYIIDISIEDGVCNDEDILKLGILADSLGIDIKTVLE